MLQDLQCYLIRFKFKPSSCSIWGCIPIGRENGLKIRTVSVRVRPALLLNFLLLNFERLIMNSKGFFIVAAFGSFVLSVSLWFLGSTDMAHEQAIFVGLWVPSILTLGSYFNG